MCVYVFSLPLSLYVYVQGCHRPYGSTVVKRYHLKSLFGSRCHLKRLFDSTAAAGSTVGTVCSHRVDSAGAGTGGRDAGGGERGDEGSLVVVPSWEWNYAQSQVMDACVEVEVTKLGDGRCRIIRLNDRACRTTLVALVPLVGWRAV